MKELIGHGQPTVEHQEQNPYDTARHALADFIETPFADYKAAYDHTRGQVESVEDGVVVPLFLLDEYKSRLLDIVNAAPNPEAAIQYLRDTVFGVMNNDRVPPLFFHEPNVEPFEEYGPYDTDVFAHWRKQWKEDGGSSLQTYRTYAISAIIDVLSTLDDPRSAEAIASMIRELSDAQKRDDEKEMGDTKKHPTDPFESYADAADIRAGDISSYRYESWRAFGYDENEYVLPIRRALEVLKKTPLSERAIDAVCGLVADPTGQVHVREQFSAVVDVLSRLPDQAGAHLFRIIADADDPVGTALAEQLLADLDRGDVSVTARGVRYVGKTFDLGEHNQAGYTVRRATADGDMVVFDEQKDVVGRFSLFAGADSDGIARVSVVPLDNPAIEAAGSEYYTAYGPTFFEKTGVPFHRAGFAEQGQLIRFLHGTDELIQARTYEFIKTYGLYGWRMFSSMEQNEHNGQALLELANAGLKNYTMQGIVREYNSILSAANGVEAFIRQAVPDRQVDDDSMRHVMDAMRRRAAGIIASAKTQLVEAEADNNIVRQLELLDADTLLFAYMFRMLQKDGGADIRAISGVEIARADGQALSPQDKRDMIDMFVANRRDNAAAYPPAWLAKRKKEFTALLESPGKTFHLLKHGRNLLAFLHLEPRGDGLYLGSVNVAPEGRGNKIGGAFLKAVIEQEGLEKSMELIVNANNAIAQSYEKDHGFTITEAIENYKNSGQTYYVMRREASGTRSA